MEERNTQYHKNLGKYDNISKPENIFKSKIVCGDCGTNLTRYKSVNKHNNVYYSYICSTHSKFADKCDFLSIGETLLTDIVMKSIKMQISNLTQLETLLETAKKRPEIRKKQYEINKKMRDVYANISYLKDSRRQLLLDFAKNILSEEEYEYARKQFDFDLEQENEKLSFVKNEQEGFDKIFVKNTWIAELKRHKKQERLELYRSFTKGRINESQFEHKRDNMNTEILLLEEKIKKQNEISICDEDEKFVQCFKRYYGLKALDQNLVEELVKSIYIYNDKRIQIVWNFCDDITTCTAH